MESNTTSTISITTNLPASTPWNFCPKCGKELNKDWQFCPDCGHGIGCLDPQRSIPWIFYPPSPYTYPTTAPPPGDGPQWTYTAGPTC